MRMAVCSALGLSALWNLMRFSTFFTLFMPLGDGVMAYTNGYINQCFAIFMTFLFIACATAMFYREQFLTIMQSSRYSALLLGAGASIGFALVNAFTLIEGASEMLLGVGVFLCAAFTCMLLILWCVRLMQEPATLAVSYFAISICVICFLLVFVALSDVFTRAYVIVAPLLAGLCHLLAPPPASQPETTFTMSEFRGMHWRLLVPILVFISLSSLFNKLVAPTESALVSPASRLITDVLTIVLFVSYLAFRKLRRTKHYSNVAFFVLAVIVMMLGLLIIVVVPSNGHLLGGPILMVSFYCFVYLLMATLIWDHVKTKASPVVLAGVFIIGSVVIPLLASNTFIYNWAANMQASDSPHSMTIAAMLSFLAAVIVFVTLGSQTSHNGVGKMSPEAQQQRLCEKIQRDFGLTDREGEILYLLYQKRSRKKIAELLTVAPSTVQGHIDHIYKKMGIHKRDELVEFIDTYEASAPAAGDAS